MMKRYLYALCLALVALPMGGHAAMRAVACEPEWAALLQELGGDKLSVYTATTAQQDPHHIQARPSLIAAVRNADLLVCTGAELETGWLPVLQRQSGNAKVQPGQPGYFEAAQYVTRLDVPTRLDRADGDVHAAGNPHIQTDPRNIGLVAQALAQRLAELDAANASFYRARQQDFAARWGAAIRRWEKQAEPLRGMEIVVHHKAFPYLENWLALREVAALEPKPGVEPGSAHLASVLSLVQSRPVKLIVRAPYNDARGADWLSQRANIPVAVLPSTVGGSPAARDLFTLFDDTLAQLQKGVK